MESTARRLGVLQAQLAPPALPPSAESSLAAQETAAHACECDGCGEPSYSVVLPETLTGNSWVVRRRVSGLAWV